MINLISNKIENRKGFTLIEVIIVMAILSILIGIAAPKMINIKARAEDRANKVTAKTIENAIDIAEIVQGKSLTNDSQNVADLINEYLEGISITIGTSYSEDDWVVNLDNEIEIWAPGVSEPIEYNN